MEAPYTELSQFSFSTQKENCYFRKGLNINTTVVGFGLTLAVLTPDRAKQPEKQEIEDL